MTVVVWLSRLTTALLSNLTHYIYVHTLFRVLYQSLSSSLHAVVANACVRKICVHSLTPYYITLLYVFICLCYIHLMIPIEGLLNGFINEKSCSYVIIVYTINVQN